MIARGLQDGHRVGRSAGTLERGGAIETCRRGWDEERKFLLENLVEEQSEEDRR